MNGTNRIIYRGTTPNVKCATSYDLTDYKIYFSIGPKPLKKWLAVDPDNINIERKGNRTYLSFQLTQEQTLSCKAGKAFAQIRAIKDEYAVASEMIPLEIKDIIEGGII